MKIWSQDVVELAEPAPPFLVARPAMAELGFGKRDSTTSSLDWTDSELSYIRWLYLRAAIAAARAERTDG